MRKPRRGGQGRRASSGEKNGKVRGIVAGSVVRRLSCKAVARQFSDEFLAATAPYQYALQTRAGTKALAHALQFLTDLLAIDGVGAFDHVKRVAPFKKLHSLPNLQPLLPLVSLLYGSESRFLRTDADGVTHTVCQAEGGEQDDPLMPALYALAQHDALVQADALLEPGERLFSFLDDLYVTTTKNRAREAFETVSGSVLRHAGVRAHLGKVKAWSKNGGLPPEGLEHAWQGDKADADNGLVVLGTPLGRTAFAEKFASERLRAEEKLLDELPKLQDLHCAWVLLSQ